MLQRLAHFYDPAEAGRILLLFVEVFGRRLERAEGDLYRVLRAHHVETADNDGSQGYIAPPEKRGDLDKVFALYLEALGGTSQLVKTNPRFTAGSFDARRLVTTLLTEKNPLTDYLYEQFQPGTWQLFLRYDVSYALLRPADIKAGLIAELILRRTPLGAIVAAQLAERAPEVHRQIMRYSGEPTIAPALAMAVAEALNRHVLHNPHFFPTHYQTLKALPLSAAAWTLIYSLYRDFLRIQAEYELQEQRQHLLSVLEQSEPAIKPLGDDIVRLNRLILDAGLGYQRQQRPWGWAPRAIPALADLRQVLARELNKLLDDPQLLTPERFPELVEETARINAYYAQDLVRLNRLALESAWPYEIEKSYEPYRKRLLGLINVLKRGASTQQGIIDIVAANLGIVGDDPSVRAAKALIDIEEFLPQKTVFYKGDVAFYQEFEIRNTNLSPEVPHVWVTMLGGPIRGLANIELIDVRRGLRVVFPGRIEPGDRLTFEQGGVLRNGIEPRERLIGGVPNVRPGAATWRFVADVVLEDGSIYPAGRYSRHYFDRSVFIPTEPIVQIEVSSYAMTYGVFTVTIPWHIPGFTDKFEESDDHPRQQILHLVNRVKAAGVQAIVAYKQLFAEDHNQSEALALTAKGELLAATQDAADTLAIDSRQTGQEDHQINDSLVLAGRLDYTSFDSLNSFA